jgi:hypothetical protein
MFLVEIREDAAEWLGYYIGNKYDGAFTLACESHRCT